MTTELDIDNLGAEFEDDIGLGAEDKKYTKGNQLEWYKGEKGRTIRAALVYFNPLDVAVIKAVRSKNPAATKEELIASITKVVAKRAEEVKKSVEELAPYEKLDITNVRFKKIEAHYKEGLGYVVSRLGKDGADADNMWKTLGEPKRYYTTVLLVYPTDNSGEVIKEQLKTGWKVIPWRFSTKVYGSLHQRANGLRENGLSIAGQDLSITCTNKEFQNFDIDTSGPAIWLKNPTFQNEVLSKAFSLYEKLVPFRELSTADLRIKLGLGGGGASEGGVTDDNFSDLMNQLG